MAIVVTILEFPAGASIFESSKSFDESCASIGRADGNQWVLDDPERFLSGQHCSIVFENSSYFLLDTSTNGTFVNQSAEPLGKGNRVQLNDGDEFELGDYKFKVQISFDNSSSMLPSKEAPPILGDDPFAAPINANQQEPSSELPPSLPLAEDPFATNGDITGLPIDNALIETDPLAALTNAAQSVSGLEALPEPFVNDQSYSDKADLANQAVNWPQAKPQQGLIPENWDDDQVQSESRVEHNPSIMQTDNTSSPLSQTEQNAFATSQAENTLKSPEDIDAGHRTKPDPQPLQTDNDQIAVSPNANKRAIEPTSLSQDIEKQKNKLVLENRKLKVEVIKLKKQLASFKKQEETGIDTSLIDAIGLDSRRLELTQIAEINATSGKLIRQTIEGIMQTLASRNNVKNTFRMNMTTIKPVENNPLKFSANVDDALDNMFFKQGNSYKKPLEAIEESFESIADHQVAILAGIRAAFKSIILRFDPSELEERFNKIHKRSLIPINEKAKYWDSYHVHFSQLFSDLDNSFQNLFGGEFSKAYEEQLQKLSQARRLSKSKKRGK